MHVFGLLEQLKMVAVTVFREQKRDILTLAQSERENTCFDFFFPRFLSVRFENFIGMLFG